MVGLSRAENQQLRVTLQDAVIKCSERGLFQSAKWYDADEDAGPQSGGRGPQEPGLSSSAYPSLSLNTDPEEARLEARELSRYLLAKSYFDCREFDRCAAVFLPDSVSAGSASAQAAAAAPSPLATTTTTTAAASATSSSHRPAGAKGKARARGSFASVAATAAAAPSSSSSSASAAAHKLPRLSQKALFLSLYAKFLAGEKRKDEESEMILGPADGGATVNRELVDLAQKLDAWCTERMAHDEEAGARSQGWLEFLYGTILVKEKNDEEARKWLVRSVVLCPFNWAAWQELASLMGSIEDLHHLIPSLPNHIMAFIFRLYVSQELYQPTEQVHNQLSDLERIFPNSVFLKTQRALLFHHSKEFDEAEAIFAEIVRTDPHRLDALDHYSNILYVMGQRPKLAFLAQLASATDKFRPETCCVVGNYYSLKSEHEKAVVYFRRALALDRRFLAAWTLMGHEYVELKNTHAAIESYRRAVDACRRDYRAWYGLGQAYEVLEMHYYALFYFQRAASLRPYDPKMWQAVGNCFHRMDRPHEAIKALKRALLAGTYYEQDGGASFSTAAGGDGGGGGGASMDPEVLYQMALMYEKLGNYEEAAAYMELTLAQEDGSQALLNGDDGDGDDDDNNNAERDDAQDDDGDRSSHGSNNGGDDDDDDDDDENDGIHIPALTVRRRRGGTGATATATTTSSAATSVIFGGGGGGAVAGGSGGGGGGIGVTQTTSKARMWLAKWEFMRGNLARAMDLANELCHDGVEVEEAKALVRDLRARMEQG